MANHDQRDPGSSDAADRGAAQLDLEDLAIDRAGEIPIGVQLAWALRARIGDGRLAPGRRLPGLRELAEMLGINANTARAVYQRLEQEGLIASRQGTGTFVASLAPEPTAVGEIAADAARRARSTGVDPRKVAAALYVATEPAGEAPTLAVERRRELRGQIAALEQTLSEIQARRPDLIPAPPERVRHAGPRLLGVEELEGVRAQLVRRLAAAEPLLEAPEQGEQAVTPELQRGAQAARAAPERQRTARATTGDADSKQVDPARTKKPVRPRTQTRPSTA